MKSKKIKFVQVMHPTIYNEIQKGVVIPQPKPSNKYTPDWYIKSENYVNSNKLIISNYSGNNGVKACVPFLEVMHSGYMIELWTDISVEKKEGYSVLNWLSTPDPVSERPHGSGENIPRPAGHLFNHFAWKVPFGIFLPKGYSCIVTHPFNRFDLPFTTLSGMMDADEMNIPGNMPFFIKEDFEGIIPAGTPIAQIFPFKREDWTSYSSIDYKKDIESIMQQTFDSHRQARGWYKKNVWKRKKYK